MRVLVLSCSLSGQSNSRLLAEAAGNALVGEGVRVALLDLRDHPLPLCDGTRPSDPHLELLNAAIEGADAILMAVPIYNYDVNAAAKNMVELTGRAWTGKVVGFLRAAGGGSSYMSVMPFANSLMLDFRCLVVPRFVYSTQAGFGGGALDAKIQERVEHLCADTLRIAGALR